MHTTSRITLTALLLAGIAIGTTSAEITLDFVTIGNPGNPNDTAPSTGFGAVGYTYNIGTYEVTLLQYTAFLNAVAQTDTYSLYNPSMGSDLNIKGIERTGSSGSYSYSTFGDAARPVTYVSWFDAARFTNWLHNGQPAGLQTAATTENGAYSLLGATSGVSFTKNGLAQYWIPSENEWYKAAYYQPSAVGGDTDGYWLYPTKSNNAPGNNIGASANQTNIYDGVDYSVTQNPSQSSSQNYLTAGGSYSASASYYGTYDQGGNVGELNDAVIGSGRGLRGGSWGDAEDILRANYATDTAPTTENKGIGFRVATVPEPTTAILLLSGVAFLLRRHSLRTRERNA